jgi:hypothetical protein
MRKKKYSAVAVLKIWESLPRSEQYSLNAKKYAKMAGLRSMLEVRSQAWLEENKVPFSYENEVWDYQYEPQKYKPDFNVPGITIECKGKLTKDVRKKLLAIIRCNPKKKLALVFERPDNKITRGSKTSYGDWAERNGIPFSAVVPDPKWFKRKK